MSNHTTGSQRYNKRMDDIFAKAKELNKKYPNPNLSDKPKKVKDVLKSPKAKYSSGEARRANHAIESHKGSPFSETK